MTGALRTGPRSCCPRRGHVAEPLGVKSGDPVPPAQVGLAPAGLLLMSLNTVFYILVPKAK